MMKYDKEYMVAFRRHFEFKGGEKVTDTELLNMYKDSYLLAFFNLGYILNGLMMEIRKSIGIKS